jgi:hypothetical protein
MGISVPKEDFCMTWISRKKENAKTEIWAHVFKLPD